jgi:mannose-6-phosphate isomerase-like protein (cupin superfamily)
MSDARYLEHDVRPWGEYFVLEEGPGYKVKRIRVKPGGRLSLQSHKERAEHWIVVRGNATVTVGTTVSTLGPGEVADIGKTEKHRLENPGAEDVEIIEVQFGAYLGEDDITRFEDAYNRA